MKTYKIACDDCGKEFGSTESCIYGKINIDGKKYSRSGNFTTGEVFEQRIQETTETCPDCGVIKSKIHHFGCMEEICPVCRGAMATCGCEGVRSI